MVIGGQKVNEAMISQIARHIAAEMFPVCGKLLVFFYPKNLQLISAENHFNRRNTS